MEHVFKAAEEPQTDRPEDTDVVHRERGTHPKRPTSPGWPGLKPWYTKPAVTS